VAYAPGLDLGTSKWLTTQQTAVNNASYAAGYQTVTLACPVGTKAVAGLCYFKSSAAGDYMQVDDMETTLGRALQYTQVANQTIIFPFKAKVTNLQFRYLTNNARVSGIYIFINEYFA
jgi:hypothetical protein